MRFLFHTREERIWNFTLTAHIIYILCTTYNCFENIFCVECTRTLNVCRARTRVYLHMYIYILQACTNAYNIDTVSCLLSSPSSIQIKQYWFFKETTRPWAGPDPEKKNNYTQTCKMCMIYWASSVASLTSNKGLTETSYYTYVYE